MQMVVFTQTQALDNGREVNGASHLTGWAGRWTEAGWFLAVRVCSFRSSACNTCKYGSRPGGSLSPRFSSGNVSRQRGMVLAVLLRHTVHGKRRSTTNVPDQLLPFIHFPQVNQYSRRSSPSPFKDSPYSFLQRYMKHTRPCWFEFLGLPATTRKKLSARVFSLPLRPPLSVPLHNGRIKSGGIWKCPHV